MPRLDGARIKLRRAAHHIEGLKREARLYLEARPFVLVQREDPNGDLVSYVSIHTPVPTDWAATVGDAVHNLRSALDHVAWQFVEAAGTTPTRDTYFPIGHASPEASIAATTRALKGASPVAHRFVHRLRTYSGGNLILNQLHALDIEDKHRLILIVGAAHTHFVLKIKAKFPWQETPFEFPPIAHNTADRKFPLQDGVEVFRVCKAARHGDQMIELGFELAFGDVSEVRGLPLIETLNIMHNHVSRIIKISAQMVEQKV